MALHRTIRKWTHLRTLFCVALAATLGLALHAVRGTTDPRPDSVVKTSCVKHSVLGKVKRGGPWGAHVRPRRAVDSAGLPTAADLIARDNELVGRVESEGLRPRSLEPVHTQFDRGPPRSL